MILSINVGKVYNKIVFSSCESLDTCNSLIQSEKFLFHKFDFEQTCGKNQTSPEGGIINSVTLNSLILSHKIPSNLSLTNILIISTLIHQTEKMH